MRIPVCLLYIMYAATTLSNNTRGGDQHCICHIYDVHGNFIVKEFPAMGKAKLFLQTSTITQTAQKPAFTYSLCCFFANSHKSLLWCEAHSRNSPSSSHSRTTYSPSSVTVPLSMLFSSSSRTCSPAATSPTCWPTRRG